MKATEQFKSVMEKYLNDTAQSDTVFAQNFSKSSKNLESCFNYIFGEVKKTGLCAFDNQEIFDMAVKYYTDDSIGIPAPVICKAVVSQPTTADLFTSAPIVSETHAQKTEMAVKTSKPSAQQTLTLFDL
ncbi:Cas9 inhibitor AcrIIA9 family protein [Flavobacterium sp. CSZ]|uniref:PcfK-like family protein n=1 Tax=Flavobacterium sp. CSZ TaxID=2783791 RepID=UPI00188BD639|nr:Cas9 inhibitor AcrIIA9 family protein [Flavobacterium sp. CSZ]MBF4485781.1 PcfK-like family protein [Flavobacterium sp. CSZ]